MIGISLTPSAVLAIFIELLLSGLRNSLTVDPVLGDIQKLFTSRKEVVGIFGVELRARHLAGTARA